MKKYLLGVDNGGTYIKAAIYDKKGKRLGIARQYNEVLKPKPGRTEYDQEKLWEINCNCIKNVITETGVDPNEIACIGIAGQGCGFYAVDRFGKSIRNAITSADARAEEIVEQWKKDGTDKKAYSKIYRHSSPVHLNALLAWLKKYEPENYAKIGYLFSMKDFLAFRFTGNAIAGQGCQSVSGLMDLSKGEFSKELGILFGIEEMTDKFGKLCWDFEEAGRLTSEAALQCGCVQGTPVAAGSHDVIAAALAMGILDSRLCFMITGTHGINGYISNEPILNGTIKYNEYFAFPGQFLIEEGYPTSSGTLEWVITTLYADRQEKSSDLYDEINHNVESVNPDSSNLLFLPFLQGNRDNPDAAGTWIGLRPEHTRAHMLRAVYEGVAFSHLLQMEHLFANREKPEIIRMAGGATASRVWIQIFADVFGITIEIVPNEEMGTKGAAIVGAVTSGLYSDVRDAVNEMTQQGEIFYPIKDNFKIYQKKIAVFKETVENLDPLWYAYGREK